MLLPSLSLVLLGAVVGVDAIPQATVTDSLPPADPTSSSSASVCNNSPDLCSRPYNQITHLGAHNAAFLRDESTDHSISGNQYENATFALDAGLRLLQSQVHNEDGGLRLCHSSCSLHDAGPLEEWLSRIEDWMAANENEVVTILLVNADSVPASEFATAFESSGLAARGYVPTSEVAPTSEWLTLETMISNNQRLVSFITNIDRDASAPYLLPEFSYVFETHFDIQSLSGFNCTVDRPSDATPGTDDGWLGLVNHFKYDNILGSFNVPDEENIETVNSAGTSEGNLGRHLEECREEWGRVPNFVLVDFWSAADPLAAVDEMNAVSEPEGRGDVAVVPTTGGSGKHMQDLGRAALLAFVICAILFN